MALVYTLLFHSGPETCGEYKGQPDFPFRSFLRFPFKLGSFSNDDGDGN